MSAGREELREKVEKWAREMALEAVTQGFQAGWTEGHRDTVQHGQSANPLSEKGVRQNEAPFVPIIGSEMDGFPEDVLALLGERAEPWAYVWRFGPGDYWHFYLSEEPGDSPAHMLESHAEIVPLYSEPVGRAPESEGERYTLEEINEALHDAESAWDPNGPRSLWGFMVDRLRASEPTEAEPLELDALTDDETELLGLIAAGFVEEAGQKAKAMAMRTPTESRAGEERPHDWDFGSNYCNACGAYSVGAPKSCPGGTE